MKQEDLPRTRGREQVELLRARGCEKDAIPGKGSSGAEWVVKIPSMSQGKLLGRGRDTKENSHAPPVVADAHK